MISRTTIKVNRTSISKKQKNHNSEKMVNGSESDLSMNSVDERKIDRRVEFEDGRVVHLPNE